MSDIVRSILNAKIFGGASSGGSGSTGGGVRIVQGSVTVAENVNQLPLFETDAVPDLLYLIYTPEANETNISSNKTWACMAEKTSDTEYTGYNYAYINGTRFTPSVNRFDKEKTSYNPFADGYLQYPYIFLTMTFAAGQTIRYTAIYFE